MGLNGANVPNAGTKAMKRNGKNNLLVCFYDTFSQTSVVIHLMETLDSQNLSESSNLQAIINS